MAELEFTMPDGKNVVLESDAPLTQDFVQKTVRAYMSGQRSLQSAQRYYQGPGEVKLTGATKPATPSEPRPRIPKPSTPKPAPQLPRQAMQTGFGPVANVPQGNPKTVSEYISRFLANTDTGTPARIAREYWASPNKESFDFKGLSPLGIKAIKQYTQEAAVTREAERGINPLEIEAYRQEYLNPDARRPEATPARIMQEYLLSPNRATFRFPKNFSAVGRAAIRAAVADMDEAKRQGQQEEDVAVEQAMRQDVGNLNLMPDVMTPGQVAATMRGLRRADVAATAAVTGQKPSEAPAAGLFPYAVTSPGRGVGESAARNLASLGMPSVAGPVAALALPMGVAAAGLGAIPAVGPGLLALGGLTAGLAPVAESAGRGAVTGDYREAAGLALTNLLPEIVGGGAAVGLRGATSLRGALLNRILQRAGQIQDIEGRMAPPARKPLLTMPAEGEVVPAPGGMVGPESVQRQPRRLYPPITEERTRTRIGSRPYKAPPRRVVVPSEKTLNEPWTVQPGATPEVQPQAIPPEGMGTAPFTPEELATRTLMTRGVDTMQENLRILMSRRNKQVEEFGTVAQDLDDAIASLVNNIESAGGTIPPEFRLGLPWYTPQKKVGTPTGAEANAVQVEGAGAGVPRTGQPEVGLPKVGEGDQVPGQAARNGSYSPTETISDQEKIKQTLGEISASYKDKNPHSGGALTGDASSFDALPDDSYVVVFHATTEANAQAILSGQKNYTPEMQAALNAGGSLSNKIYVASDPRAVSGMGETIIGFVVKKSDLKPSPEAINAKQTLGQSVVSVSTGAVISGNPEASFYVGRQQKIGHSSEIGSDALSNAYESAKINGDNPSLVGFVEKFFKPQSTGKTPVEFSGRAAAGAAPDRATLVDEVSGVLNEAAGIKQQLQRDEAISLGLADQTPKQGSVSPVLRRDIENAVADPELRNAYIDQIKNTNWNDPAQVGNLSTGHQTAAFIRQRELTPLLNDPDPTIRRAAINEWTQMHQAIYKIGSKKGFDLAMQKLFNITVDFSSPDVQNDLMAYITATMRNSGATDAQIDAAIARILPRAEQGRVTYGQVNTQANNAANVADEVLRNARASGRRMTEPEIMAEYQRRLALLDQTTLPRWAGKSSPLVSVAVREFRNGVRKLEDVKARIKDMYGDDIPDAVLNDIMRKARIEFEADNKKVDAVIGAINKDVSDEVWKTYSRGRKALERLRSVQNFERLIVLGLDLGIFGVQFGLAGATRPALMFAQMPSGKRTGVERAAAMTVGGIPSPRAAFSADKGGGIVPATIKAFGTERGALAAEEDIATLARTRYPEFDDPFAEAGLMGFRDGDIRGAGLTRELSFDTQRAIESLPAWMRGLYQSSQRGTETGLRYGRALIFDQMMGSFENLPKDQKLQAMQAVASFVNTLTGGGTYGQGVEAALKFLGNLQTAPRYYTSNIEMVSLVSPAARTLYAGRKLPAKEIGKLAGLVGAEYGRMATTMLMLKYMLAPLGGEVVADLYDQDFGTVRLKLTDGSEETISILAGREKYVPLLLTTVKGKKRQRVVSGGPSMWENLSVSDRLDMLGNVLYGKSTVIPRNLVGLIPAKRPPETAMEAPSMSSYLRSEFRSPGGQAFVPAQAMNDPLKSLLYIGERVVPAPLFAKQLAQNLPYYVGEGSTEKGKRILALARSANALLSNVGVQANVKMTPEMVQRITSGAPMQEADIQRLPPAEREKFRMSIMTSTGSGRK